MTAFDVLAVRIGDAYRRGILAHAEAGKMLADKKATLDHGEWTIWLKVNREPLGFDSIRTAARLMSIARIPKETLVSPLAAKLVQRIRGKVPTRDALLDPLLESHQSYEWYTPPKYIARVKNVFGGEIDLDPASCREANKYVRAKKFYTREQDGRRFPWPGKIYGNVPFQSVIMAPFVDYLIEQLRIGNTTEAIWCVGGATDQAWFQKLCAHAAKICFTRGRIPFIPPGGRRVSSPTGDGGSFSYFGPNPEKFQAEFHQVIGSCVTPDR